MSQEEKPQNSGKELNYTVGNPARGAGRQQGMGTQGYGAPQGGGYMPQYGTGAQGGGMGMPSYPYGGYQSGAYPPMGQQSGGMFAASPMGPSGPGGIEQSYIENIFRMNAGKTTTVYMTFENNSEWSAKVFRGQIEAAGRDHLILSDPKTGMRYLLPLIYLDYATFQGPINYSYPFGSGQS